MAKKFKLGSLVAFSQTGRLYEVVGVVQRQPGKKGRLFIKGISPDDGEYDFSEATRSVLLRQNVTPENIKEELAEAVIRLLYQKDCLMDQIAEIRSVATGEVHRSERELQTFGLFYCKNML